MGILSALMSNDTLQNAALGQLKKLFDDKGLKAVVITKPDCPFEETDTVIALGPLRCELFKEPIEAVPLAEHTAYVVAYQNEMQRKLSNSGL
jgi:hypothetical protein